MNNKEMKQAIKNLLRQSAKTTDELKAEFEITSDTQGKFEAALFYGLSATGEIKWDYGTERWLLVN